MGKAHKFSKALRLDSIPLKKAYYTAEGFLRDKPVLTSTGIFEYTNSDGSIRRELRLPEDVFDPKSLQSFKGKPVVISHDAGLITKDNVGENSIGAILSDGERFGDDVRAEIIIHDTDEMKDCGYKELSLGYNLDLEEKSGEWHGQHYDAIQRNIRINHLALVREARAGEQARLNLDGRDNNTLIGGKKMKNPRKATRRNDGILSPDELQKAIEEYKKRRGNQMSQEDEDDVPEEEVKEEVEVVEDEDDVPVLPDRKKVKDVEKRVQFVKDRRDRRDEEGDPEDTDEAMGIIANQDEDIDYLFDIIDTLLAERDYTKTDSIDDLEKLKGDAEDEEMEEPDEELPEDVEEDEDEEEMLPEDVEEDEDDEEVIPEDEEMEEDEDDVLEELPEEEEEDEDDIPEEIPEDEEEDEDDVPEDDEPLMNADSVDAIVRERIRIGIIGRQLGLKNLESKSPRAAKKAIIRKTNPRVNLDGKSASYIDAMYDMAVAKARKMSRKPKKTVSYQKKQMFNKDSRTVSKKISSADAARNRMIARQQKSK